MNPILVGEQNYEQLLTPLWQQRMNDFDYKLQITQSDFYKASTHKEDKLWSQWKLENLKENAVKGITLMLNSHHPNTEWL